MSEARDLHRQAMRLADQADRAQLRGDAAGAGHLREQALEVESRAAELLLDRRGLEPTRAILYKSAAVLALRCGRRRRAEQLVAEGLAGDPPDDVAEDLRDLLEQVNFERHRQLRGVTLLPDEFQVSIAGDAVGQGFASKDAILDRLNIAEKLLVRTAERRRGAPFRDKGRPPRDIAEKLQLFMSAPRAGSFALTVKIGTPSKQMELPGLDETADVVEETLSCLELVEGGAEVALRERIPEPNYYENFIGLARALAPDGEAVTMVGLVSKHVSTKARNIGSP